MVDHWLPLKASYFFRISGFVVAEELKDFFQRFIFSLIFFLPSVHLKDSLFFYHFIIQIIVFCYGGTLFLLVLLFLQKTDTAQHNKAPQLQYNVMKCKSRNAMEIYLTTVKVNVNLFSVSASRPSREEVQEWGISFEKLLTSKSK